MCTIRTNGSIGRSIDPDICGLWGVEELESIEGIYVEMWAVRE